MRDVTVICNGRGISLFWAIILIVVGMLRAGRGKEAVGEVGASFQVQCLAVSFISPPNSVLAAAQKSVPICTGKHSGVGRSHKGFPCTYSVQPELGASWCECACGSALELGAVDSKQLLCDPR